MSINELARVYYDGATAEVKSGTKVYVFMYGDRSGSVLFSDDRVDITGVRVPCTVFGYIFVVHTPIPSADWEDCRSAMFRKAESWVCKNMLPGMYVSGRNALCYDAADVK